MNTQKYIFSFFVFLLICGAFLGGAKVSAQLKMPMMSNADAQAMVNSVFSGIPEMIAIASCESGIRQYGSDGLPLRGGNGSYIGIFQISESSHADFARSLGFDIYETSGNVGYAKYLYDKRGTDPWISCIKNPAAAPSSPAAASVPGQAASAAALTSNLQMGMAGPQVLTLQQLLNATGFSIAASGPGSPGNETTQFGALTRQAVMRLQCSNKLVCEGSESTTGYGRLGPLTRTLLLQLAAEKKS